MTNVFRCFNQRLKENHPLIQTLERLATERPTAWKNVATQELGSYKSNFLGGYLTKTTKKEDNIRKEKGVK